MFHLMLIDNKEGYGYCKDNPIKVKDYEGLKEYIRCLTLCDDSVYNHFTKFALNYNKYIYDKKEKQLYITYYIYVKVSSKPLVIKRYQLYFRLFNTTNSIKVPSGFKLLKRHSFGDFL